MSFGLLWRSVVAVVLGAGLGFLALSFINGADNSADQNGADQPAPSPAGASHFVPRLTLVRQATNGQLISFQVGPFEVGANDFRVRLLDPIGRAQRLDSAQLRLFSLESPGVAAEVEAAGTAQGKEGRLLLPTAGWWQIDVTANGSSTATFYLKLEQPSDAPASFAPPDYESDPEAQQLFEAAVARYEGLSGLSWREELTSGDPGPSGFGVWFITNLESSREGYHATSLNVDRGSSELYSDETRRCFRQSREAWQCSDGGPPIGPFDLSYLKNATGFRKGIEEVVDGEMTQVIFFYNESQGAWYAWWIGEETNYVRRQAMVATGHFMLDRYSGHDSPQQIQPGDLPPA